MTFRDSFAGYFQTFFSSSWNYEKWISGASIWSVKHFQWTHCPSRCGHYTAKPFSRFKQSIMDLSINIITIIPSLWSFQPSLYQPSWSHAVNKCFPWKLNTSATDGLMEGYFWDKLFMKCKLRIECNIYMVYFKDRGRNLQCFK